MLTAIRELAEAAERGGDLAAIVARGDDSVARTREHAAGAARGRCRRRRRGRARRDRARHRRRDHRRGAAAAARARGGVRASRRSTRSSRATATARCSSSRARASTPTRSKPSSSSSATRCSSSATATALKVHVHTDDPGRALSLGVARGAIGGVEIANMHAQTQQREERLLHAVPETGERVPRSSPSSSGDGNRTLFESLGARRRRRRPDDEPVDGRSRRGDRGRAPAEEVIVLANTN